MINIAIAGYGNVGRGVINALKNNPDMKLSAMSSLPALYSPYSSETLRSKYT